MKEFLPERTKDQENLNQFVDALIFQFQQMSNELSEKTKERYIDSCPSKKLPSLAKRHGIEVKNTDAITPEILRKLLKHMVGKVATRENFEDFLKHIYNIRSYISIHNDLNIFVQNEDFLIIQDGGVEKKITFNNSKKTTIKNIMLDIQSQIPEINVSARTGSNNALLLSSVNNDLKIISGTLCQKLSLTKFQTTPATYSFKTVKNGLKITAVQKQRSDNREWFGFGDSFFGFDGNFYNLQAMGNIEEAIKPFSAFENGYVSFARLPSLGDIDKNSYESPTFDENGITNVVLKRYSDTFNWSILNETSYPIVENGYDYIIVNCPIYFNGQEIEINEYDIVFNKEFNASLNHIQIEESKEKISLHSPLVIPNKAVHSSFIDSKYNENAINVFPQIINGDNVFKLAKNESDIVKDLQTKVRVVHNLKESIVYSKFKPIIGQTIKLGSQKCKVTQVFENYFIVENYIASKKVINCSKIIATKNGVEFVVTKGNINIGDSLKIISGDFKNPYLVNKYKMSKVKLLGEEPEMWFGFNNDDFGFNDHGSFYNLQALNFEKIQKDLNTKDNGPWIGFNENDSGFGDGFFYNRVILEAENIQEVLNEEYDYWFGPDDKGFNDGNFYNITAIDLLNQKNKTKSITAIIESEKFQDYAEIAGICKIEITKGVEIVTMTIENTQHLTSSEYQSGFGDFLFNYEKEYHMTKDFITVEAIKQNYVLVKTTQYISDGFLIFKDSVYDFKMQSHLSGSFILETKAQVQQNDKVYIVNKTLSELESSVKNPYLYDIRSLYYATFRMFKEYMKPTGIEFENNLLVNEMKYISTNPYK